MKTSKKRVRFEVSFNLPADASVSDARTYVAEALYAGHMSASWTVDHTKPMYELDRSSISVKRIGPVKSRRPHS